MVNAAANRKPYVLLLLVVIATSLFAIAYLTLNSSPWSKVHAGMSKSEVQSVMGKPGRIYEPGERMGTYGAQPPPPAKHNQEVWVYTKLMKLTFVYFDEHGRVRRVFHTTT